MRKPLFDVERCVVCGCTGEHGCAGGCQWVLADPNVCSSCVQPFLFADLWHAIGLLQREDARAAAAVKQLRAVYRALAAEQRSDHLDADEWTGIVPTFKQVAQINRRAEKSVEGSRR